MKSVDAHLKQVLAAVGPLAELELRLLEAHGCVLAEDVVAERPSPAFDTATTDGYAVRSADVTGPTTLHVAGDLKRGHAPNVVVQPGLCVRLADGAAVPQGADAVVPVRLTDGGLAQVRIDAAAVPGAFVKRAGSDMQAGATSSARTA